MKKSGVKNILAGVGSFLMTLIVLILLFLSSSADAFLLSINLENNIVYNDSEKEVSFIVSLDINSNERLPVDYLVLDVIGSDEINCRFKVDGTKISGCERLNIERISIADYSLGNLSGSFKGQNYSWGYGYGYGYGEDEKLMYNISLNSSEMDYGVYESFFRAKLGNNEFSEKGGNITILEKVNITELGYSPLCVSEGEDIIFNSKVTGSVKEVYLEICNGVCSNRSMTPGLNGVYSYVLNGSEVKGGVSISYRVIAIDIANELSYRNGGSIYVNKMTKLITTPENPDGLNGWFVSEPKFILDNSDASRIYYRWENRELILYGGEFGLENIPNAPPIESAGTLGLSYFAETTCGNESVKSQIIYVDLTNPEIKQLTPENNSVVIETKPLISAYLDEVYQGNSRIDNNSLIMKLDGEELLFNLTNEGESDIKVSYTPENDLAFGEHKVFVYAKDLSGRDSSLEWNFTINEENPFSLFINSPVNENIYNFKRINLNLTSSRNSEKIEYIDLEDVKPRWRVLCKDCDEYGMFKSRIKSFKEGNNSLIIKATENEKEVQEELVFFVDSKEPILKDSEPKQGFALGNFSVLFQEENPVKLVLKYGNVLTGWKEEEIDLEGCDVYENNKKYTECFSWFNLIEFDGQEIEYWFILEDIVGRTDESRLEKLEVDVSAPILLNEEFYYFGEGRYKDYAYFEINISEKNFEEAVLNYKYERRGKIYEDEKKLCSQLKKGICEKRALIKDNYQDLKIIVRDEAGNSMEREVEF